jgi:oligopeptide transport system substrate-binding protein
MEKMGKMGKMRLAPLRLAALILAALLPLAAAAACAPPAGGAGTAGSAGGPAAAPAGTEAAGAAESGGAAAGDTGAGNSDMGNSDTGSSNTGNSGGSGAEADAAGSKEINIAAEGESGSFDPAKNVGRTYWNMHGDCLEGLVTYTQGGELEYRAAESHEANGDQTVWTFQLRGDGKWSNGDDVVAEDFVNTIRRALDPANQSTYADMLFYIKGAQEAYQEGAPFEGVGVRAIGGRTLEFTLSAPCPYFLKLLFLPVYYPSNRNVATDENENWDKDTDSYPTNGAYRIGEYSPGEYWSFYPNEYYRDRASVKLSKLTYRFMDDMQARLAAYKTGELDVVGSVPYYALDEYRETGEIYSAKNMTSLYALFNLENEALKDPRVREALVISIDRGDLCSVMGDDHIPASNFVNPNMPSTAGGGKLFSETAPPPFEEDAERARALLAEAGYPGGEGFPTLTYIYPNAEEDSNAAQVLQGQWKEKLGINVELSAMEQQVYLSERRARNFDIARMSWGADFSDPMTYLAMYTSYSGQNDPRIADAEYDAAVQASDVEADPARREALLHEAEVILVGKNFYISPLYAINNNSIIKPNVTGVTKDVRGLNNYRFVDVAG